MTKVLVTWEPDWQYGGTPDPVWEVLQDIPAGPYDGIDPVSEWLSDETGFLVRDWVVMEEGTE